MNKIARPQTDRVYRFAEGDMSISVVEYSRGLFLASRKLAYGDAFRYNFQPDLCFEFLTDRSLDLLRRVSFVGLEKERHYILSVEMIYHHLILA